MWFGGYNVALNAAEHLLDAGTSALLINVNPILVAIMAGIFLKEGFPALADHRQHWSPLAGWR